MALIAVALSVTAYATVLGGASAVSTDEIKVDYTDLTGVGTIPKGSAVEKSIGSIKLTNFGAAGLAAGDNIRVRFELMLNPDIYNGFRSLIVQISDVNGVVAMLTPNTVYDEVVEKLVGAPDDIVYYVKVIAVVGDKTLTGAQLYLRATAMVENMA